jgi:hypothetical protein
MSNKIKAPKVVEDFTEEDFVIIEETTGFVRQNYIKSFKLPMSFWQDNLKFLNAEHERRGI